VQCCVVCVLRSARSRREGRHVEGEDKRAKAEIDKVDNVAQIKNKTTEQKKQHERKGKETKGMVRTKKKVTEGVQGPSPRGLQFSCFLLVGLG